MGFDATDDLQVRMNILEGDKYRRESNWEAVKVFGVALGVLLGIVVFVLAGGGIACKVKDHKGQINAVQIKATHL